MSRNRRKNIYRAVKNCCNRRIYLVNPYFQPTMKDLKSRKYLRKSGTQKKGGGGVKLAKCDLYINCNFMLHSEGKTSNNRIFSKQESNISIQQTTSLLVKFWFSTFEPDFHFPFLRMVFSKQESKISNNKQQTNLQQATSLLVKFW